jgi:leucyl aminopeptidase (aminopeptidase T)
MSSHWKDFGDIAVRRMAGTKPGESLLVLADTKTDLEVARACFDAGIAAGARPSLLVIPFMSPTDTRELDDTTVGAIAGADVVIGVCETMFVSKESTDKALEAGVRITSTNVNGMEDFAIEGIRDVDYDRMIVVGTRIGELWQSTELCRVTSPFGTDITFDLRDRPIDLGTGMATEPGQADFFPGVSVANAPIENTIQGTIVVDGNVPPGRLPKAPVTLQIKDGVIVDFEGGEDADALRAYFAESDDSIATYLCHFTLGLNPRARTSGSVHQDEHVLGAVTFGFGSQAPAFGGTVPPCNVHCDVVLTTAKIECDGRIMLEDNKLNEEMGFGGLS